MGTTRKLAQGIAVTLGASLASVTLSVITTLILLRFLSIPEFGVYALVVSSVSLATMAIDLGVRNLVIADAAQELGRKRAGPAKEILKSYVKFELRAALIGSPLVFAISYAAMHAIGAPQPVLLGLIVAMGMFFNAGLNVFASVFYSFQRFGDYALLQVATSAAELLLIFSFTRWLNLGVVGAAAGFALGTLFGMLATIPHMLAVYRTLKPVRTPRTGLFSRAIRRHGKYSIAAAVAKPIADNAPLWILQAVSGLGAVGIYSAAFRVFAFIVMFPITLENVLLPTLSGLFHESRRKMEAVYFRAVKYNLLLSAGLAVVAFFAAPALVDLLFPKYSQAIIVFDVMLLALIVYGFGSGQRSIFFAFKAQRQFFYSFLFTLAITFAAGIPASIMWNGVGMAGVFVSTLVLATALRSYYIAKLDRRFRVRFHELLRVDEFDRKLLARAWQKVLHRQQPPDEAVRP